MNRFFDITSIRSDELLPWELQKLGLSIKHPRFRLWRGLRFRSDIAGGVIVLPDGMISDLASIPGVLQNLLENDDPRISGGAWVHDYLCDTCGKIALEDGKKIRLSHTQAAAILAHEAMHDLGAGILLRNAVFEAVNNFGPQF